MAIAAAAVWEYRTSATASNANGGFFVTGASGSDFSQQDAAQYNLTGVTSAGAGNTVLTASAAADMVGNGARCTSGTNFTTGWFEVTSVVAGVSITFSTNVAGTSICSGVGSAGVINIGGAMSLGSSDDAVFEAGAAGNQHWIKAGTYTIGGAVSISLAGTNSAKIKFYGYNSTRGDNPTGSTRPLFALGSNSFSFGSLWEVAYLQFTGTAATMLTTGNTTVFSNIKAVNSSTTATRIALLHSAGGMVFACEGVSYRGTAFNASSATTNPKIISCYAHDSNVGIAISTAGCLIKGNLVESNVAQAINISGANTSSMIICENTLYGGANKTGVGIDIATGSTSMQIINNIITGFTTGISHADAANPTRLDYNDFYNNTTDVTNVTMGSNDVTLDPQFTNVGQITGTTAVLLSSNRLQDTTKNFGSLGVVANQDYLYYVSGSGAAVAGQYLITAITTVTNTNDTLTVDQTLTANATGDHVYQITTGRNFAIGTNLKGLGLQGVFPGSLTTGYADIGAVQRQEAGGGGETAYSFVG